jgi:hypothetical protein
MTRKELIKLKDVLDKSFYKYCKRSNIDYWNPDNRTKEQNIKIKIWEKKELLRIREKT